MIVSDVAGNIHHYQTVEWTLTVYSIQDVLPPSLTGVTFTPPSIDTTSGPATVTVNFTATDDLSGVSYISFALRSPSGQQSRYGGAGCQPPSTSCSTSAEVVFPQYGEAGTWTFGYVIVSDAAGNIHHYQTVEWTLTVYSIQDVLPPSLTGVTFTPPSIDTTSGPATVTVSFTATDDLSGVSYISFALRSPSGQQSRYGGAGCQPPSTDCSTSAEVVFPQYGEEGIWTFGYVIASDAAGNINHYQTVPWKMLSTPLIVPELVFVTAGATPVDSSGKKREILLQTLIQNIGAAAARNVRVDFDFSADGGMTFAKTSGESHVADMQSGAMFEATQKWKVAPGSYLVRITLDAQDRIAEYSETNNVLVFPVSVP